MSRFANILFSPLGDNDNSLAVRNITKLIVDDSVHLEMLGVVDVPSGLRRLVSRAGLDEELQELQRADAERKLATWARRVGCSSVTTDVAVGKPASVIVEHVLESNHDLVVVTTDDDRHDRATIRRLMENCPCPVWVIRPTRARIQRVMAAVNPDPDELALNRRILELAASMTELNGGELHVVHAWSLLGESTMRSSAFARTPSSQVDELVEIERAARSRALEDLISGSTVATAPWQQHLVKGSAADVVPDLAAKHKINLLVMGTVARTGLSGLVMGNTAECILADVDCSVVAVKPPGFGSPTA